MREEDKGWQGGGGGGKKEEERRWGASKMERNREVVLEGEGEVGREIT